MQSKPSTLVVLGTGGTIAGTSASALDDIGYSAARLGAAQLIAALPQRASSPIEVEQIAQIDSKDMDVDTWRALALAVEHHLGRPEVVGIVVTHGTDTLEETAYFLQRLLAPTKPVVLVAAMRPASSTQADGPQNLLDAITVARTPDARGVVAVLAGTVLGALDVRKVHTYRLDAFGSGDAGPIAHVEAGHVRRHRAWPEGEAIGSAAMLPEAAAWPWVEIVTSHAQSNGDLVRATLQGGAAGIVVAGTGNGTVHHALEAVLLEAQAAGVAVLRSSRCGNGRVIDAGSEALPSAGVLTPVQARVELLLRLLAQRHRATASASDRRGA